VAPGAEFHAPEFVGWLAGLSLGLAVVGIGTAWLLYGARRIAPERLTVRPLHRLAVNKYYMDDLYEGVLAGRLFYRAACGALDLFDRSVVDGTVDTIGWLGRNLGRAVGQVQTGQVQAYGAVFTVGFGVIMLVYLVWR
jgi:NADH-quinone oxidoreductase subunit L